MLSYKYEINPIINDTKESQIEFFREQGLVRRIIKCVHCDKVIAPTQRRDHIDGFVFMCLNKGCKKVKTTRLVRTESFFADIRLSLGDSLSVMWGMATEKTTFHLKLETERSKRAKSGILNLIRLKMHQYLEKKIQLI
eukprot:GHVP01068488.1.p1 GENE.GHVP01068488.1~~GHVP01068488.1.p1  ORF type:complete len:138 (+),score=7.26 GHVP01068488.1:3-416(+)